MIAQELTRALRRIKEAWVQIVGEREDDQLRLDASTVRILQGRCPYRSSEDDAQVRMRMLSGEILPAFKADDQRTRILERIRSIEYVIPSLHTFLEDTKYLEPCAKILKAILPAKSGRSLSQHFQALYNSQTGIKIQKSEFDFEDRPGPSSLSSSWTSYRQLWLFALRHFPVMGGEAPRKRKARESAGSTGEQQRWWYELPALASKLGYRRVRWRYHDLRAADAQAIGDCVRSLVPEKYYRIDAKRMHQIVQVTCQLIGDVPPVKSTSGPPELTSDHNSCGSDISDRCGRPYDDSLAADEDKLFFDYIYEQSYDMRPKRYLTSFDIKRDFFHSFFGSSPDNLDQHPGLATSEDGIADDRARDRSSSYLQDPKGQPTSERPPPSAGVSDPQVEQEEEDRRCDKGLDHPVVPPDTSQGSASPMQATTTAVDDQSALVASDPSPSAIVESRMEAAQEKAVPVAEASQFLFSKEANAKKRSFSVLSPTDDGGFRRREADALDRPSMIKALRLPSGSHFMARDNGKRLKMTAPATILEEARSGRLNAVLSIPRHKVQEFANRFDTHDEEEEL